MDIDAKIKRSKAKIENYRRILEPIPEDTFLSRYVYGKLLEKEEEKLKDLLNTKNSCS